MAGKSKRAREHEPPSVLENPYVLQSLRQLSPELYATMNASAPHPVTADRVFVHIYRALFPRPSEGQKTRYSSSSATDGAITCCLCQNRGNTTVLGSLVGPFQGRYAHINCARYAE
jgi:hypothetical protein